MSSAVDARVYRPDDIDIPYRMLGSGKESRMLFAHDLTATGLSAGGVFDRLVSAGWSVVAMDQRGHGKATPATDPAQFTPQAMGGDLLAIMDDLGCESACLAGGSMGAAPALAAAVAAPERVGGLLLMAPGFGDRPNPSRERFADIAAAFERGGMAAGMRRWREVMTERSMPTDVVERQVQQLSAHNPQSLACWLRVIPAWTLPEEIAAVAGLPMPVVVIAWEDDEIHPLDLAERIAHSAPQGHLHMIDRTAGPMALSTAARDELARIVTR